MGPWVISVGPQIQGPVARSIFDILRSRRSISTRKLIELTTYFYSFILIDYKNIIDFSG
jgi:hypothetical protein